ncbi:MAG: rhomboid family intramembrane serine protease [Muribaculaceae bacterium]|nr:rhomboid family intramembrane serine protease [Muribaculaceae bacterium]
MIRNLYRLKAWWLTRSLAVRIIIVNVAVLVAGRITGIIVAGVTGGSATVVFEWLAMPPTAEMWMHRPWTTVTYMFTQEDVWHTALNMLWLYGFATIFRMTCTSRQLMGLYLLGGFGGAALYALIAYTDPSVAGSGLIGSSAAVLAVITGTAIILPDFEVRVFLIGMVRIKWIALILAAVFLAGSGMSATAAMTHAGGIAAGVAFGLQMRRGTDITAPLNRALDRIANLLRPTHGDDPWQRRQTEPPPRRNMEDVIEKIRRSGYASLSDDEKRRFFDFTNRRN